MDVLELAQWAVNGLLDLFLHFVWASCAGSLAFALTFWTTRMLYSLLACLLRSPTSPPARVARGMAGFGLAAALFVSLSVHMWWDRLLFIY
jgi:ABC-type multidrug transport system permease subunit